MLIYIYIGAREKGNVTQAKAEETESEPEAEDKADEAQRTTRQRCLLQVHCEGATLASI